MCFVNLHNEQLSAALAPSNSLHSGAVPVFAPTSKTRIILPAWPLGLPGLVSVSQSRR